MRPIITTVAIVAFVVVIYFGLWLLEKWITFLTNQGYFVG